MLQLALLVKTLLSSTIILQTLVYFIIGLALWLCYFGLIKKVSNDKANCEVNHTGINKINYYLPAIAITILLALMLYAISYVGFLPYGPDTNGYPGVLKRLLEEGHYHGRAYYTLYHTSAVLFSICSMIIGPPMNIHSQQIAYTTLLSALLTSLILVCSTSLSRLYRVSWELTTLVLVLLFISTPPIGGFDLLQQYVSSVYAAMGVTFLLSAVTTNSMSKYKSLIVFVILVLICIVTHLTPILLVAMLITAYFTISRNYSLKVGFIIFLLIAATYTLFAANLTDILKSLHNLFISLERGTIREPSIYAYKEIPSTRISLLAWSLLPSMAAAYILVSMFSAIARNFAREKNSNVSLAFSDMINVFTNTVLIVSMIFLVLAVISKATPVDVSRYFWQPSYMMLLLTLSPTIVRILSKCKRILIFLTLLLLFLVPYIYASLNDPHRLPQKGELRLAPVTLTDRIEMLPIAKFGLSGYYVYAWHDVIIPTYLVKNPPQLRAGIGSYGPTHNILMKVAMGLRVNIPRNSYVIIHKEVVTNACYNIYNLVYIGSEHMVLIPAW